jgi:diaminopimelate decarboxylase
MINVESEGELHRVELMAQNLQKEARISIRVNPNVDPKTHPYISTGLHENKFGVDIDTAKRMYIMAKKSDYLDPIGVHCHIGSQLTELAPIKEAVNIVADLVRNIKAALDIELKFFDVGGGLGIVYDNETLIDTYEYAQTVLDALHGLDITVVCEPGRYIVGNSGVFVTKVLYEKINGEKRFVIVDGAMNDLLRPSLYDAYHKIEVLNKSENISSCNVVGPVCESGDFFGKNIGLPLTEHNDLIAIYSSGAYGFTMASNYNTRGKVAEIALENGEDRLIRKRETFEDMVALEEQYLK